MPPGLVRYGRTPDKVRRQEVERAAAEVATPLPEPEPESPADPGRVRYWRTPQRMLQQVWGGGSPGAPAPELVSQVEAEMIGEGEDALIAPDLDSPLPEQNLAEAVTTPFAFLSDAAFWEFIPDAEQEDEAVFESVPPVVAVPTGQLFGKVHRVAHGAAVAARNHFPSRLQDVGHQLGCRVDRIERRAVGQQRRQGVLGFFERSSDAGVGHRFSLPAA